MSALIGEAFPVLEERMRFRVARQALLAANLANADTPGYRRADLRFEKALAAAAARPSRTHPRHLSTQPGPYALEIGPLGTRPDGNGVDSDFEAVQVSRNAGAFKDYAEVLGRIVALRRLALGRS